MNMQSPYPMPWRVGVPATPSRSRPTGPAPTGLSGSAASITDAGPSLIKLVNAHRHWERQWAYHAPFAKVSRLDARDAELAKAAAARVKAEIARRFPEYAAKRMGGVK